jgi:predicted homoserine dehydrogenase-like protein
MLERLKQLTTEIRVGIVGAGSMGKGLVYQSALTPGLACVAIADINLERTIDSIRLVNKSFRVVDNLSDLHDTVRQGSVAVCEDGNLVADCEMVDVFVESSSSVREGGDFSERALLTGKHLVLMNAEVDLIFGPYLMALADREGVAYTSCDGDQHGVIKHLVDDLRLWGFDLVMTGNIKGFLDRYSNPTKIIPEADKRALDYRMATAYTDGTKLCIEMALVANALGLSALKPGMYGPRATHVREALDLFPFPELWAAREPFVDYILGGEPGGGVFAVGYCDNGYQRSMLSYYKMGDGPFYLFYRPYHICHVEAMACIAGAFLDGGSVLRPDHGFRTNVFAYAKRDLRKGERLDGIGGYACYGLIENVLPGDERPGLPICLTENVPLLRDIPQDSKIFLSDVSVDGGRSDFLLYEKALLASVRATE